MIASDLARRQAAILLELGELAKTEPAAVDSFVVALVAHIRAWRPESVSPLGTLPEATEFIRDPRTGCRLCRNPSHSPILGSFDAIIAAEYGLGDHGAIDASGLCALCVLGALPNSTEPIRDPRSAR